MRYLILALILIATPSFAATNFITNRTALNEDLRNPIGIGEDIVVWENKTSKVNFIEEITAQHRYDWQNGSNSFYGVVRINPWKVLKNE